VPGVLSTFRDPLIHCRFGTGPIDYQRTFRCEVSGHGLTGFGDRIGVGENTCSKDVREQPMLPLSTQIWQAKGFGSDEE